MALIECPHCKETVSDSCERCIHCGERIRKGSQGGEAVQEERDQGERLFRELSKAEQESLWSEFYALYPKYEKVGVRGNSYKKILWYAGLEACILPITAFLVNFFLKGKDILSSETFLMGLSFIGVLFLKGMITIILMATVFLKKNKRQKLIVLKRFQAWLDAEKGINYTVKFDRNLTSEQMLYETIDLKTETF